MIRYALNNWVYPGEDLRPIFGRAARFGYAGIELIGEPEDCIPSYWAPT